MDSIKLILKIVENEKILSNPPNNSYFCVMGKKKTDKIVFENVKILDAGAKGVSVAKAPDGKVIFLPNVVPCDVVDVQTMKKRKAYY